MILKLRSERRGTHIHTRFFSAPEEGQTFRLLGSVVSDIVEWQSIGAALLLGAERMQDRLRVVFDGAAQNIEEYDFLRAFLRGEVE